MKITDRDELNRRNRDEANRLVSAIETAHSELNPKASVGTIAMIAIQLRNEIDAILDEHGRA